MAGSRPDILALKRMLSPHLLDIPGVAGVGVGAEHVRVYLVKDDAAVRSAVSRAVAQHAPEAPIEVSITGAFQKQ